MISFTGNCNDLEFGFAYYLGGGSNAPSDYCWIMTLDNGRDKGQFAFNVNNAWIRRRSGNDWSSWLSLV